MIETRIAKVVKKMEENNLDAILITKPENIRYLSGFTGGSDAVLLISEEKNYIFTDTRYIEQVNRECPGWELRVENPAGQVETIAVSNSFNRLGFESQHITYYNYKNLVEKLKCDFISTRDIIEELRVIKDEKELDCLRGAASTGDRVFSTICGLIRPGVDEKYIANNIVYYLKEFGCDKESFDTISVSGENAALPHGQPGDKLIVPGDMLTLDYGGFFKGYAGDMTRTIAVARADQDLKDKYSAVLEAQMIGLDMVREGVHCKDIDQAIRDCLKKYSLDQYFIHGTGHGVGLEIHEAPRVSFSSDEILRNNMVITIEPGIYISGWGGIRIEDTVIVKDGSCEVLTHSNKNLLIIDGGIE